ncbi:MAG TPA: hypothetical protein VGD17_14995 [Chitinophagaceae bacterium]
MKKIYFILIASFTFITVSAQQDFAKHLGEARTAYAAGKLDDSRFAMQQALQELDILIGKEVIKVLPTKMLDENARIERDNVTGASGFFGVLIHREYGIDVKKLPADSIYSKTVSLEIISNSPLIGTLNALLSLPFMGNNPDQKIIKVSGYKALVQKVSGDDEKKEFELQLPLTNALVTLKAPGHTQDELIKMANTLPIGEIAKLIQ